jgi:hypothetical protein
MLAAMGIDPGSFPTQAALRQALSTASLEDQFNAIGSIYSNQPLAYNVPSYVRPGGVIANPAGKYGVGALPGLASTINGMTPAQDYAAFTSQGSLPQQVTQAAFNFENPGAVSAPPAAEKARTSTWAGSMNNLSGLSVNSPGITYNTTVGPAQSPLQQGPPIPDNLGQPAIPSFPGMAPGETAPTPPGRIGATNALSAAAAGNTNSGRRNRN